MCLSWDWLSCVTWCVSPNQCRGRTGRISVTGSGDRAYWVRIGSSRVGTLSRHRVETRTVTIDCTAMSPNTTIWRENWRNKLTWCADTDYTLSAELDCEYVGHICRCRFLWACSQFVRVFRFPASCGYNAGNVEWNLKIWLDDVCWRVRVDCET